MTDGRAISGDTLSGDLLPDQTLLRDALSLGVLVCTYRRPDALERCLAALDAQSRCPDDVIVVCRVDDSPSRQYLAGRPSGPAPVRVVTVDRPGVVAARNMGLSACRTAVLAQIDDDTEPLSDWALRIVIHFAAAADLGGLSGRDLVHDGHEFDRREKGPVGRLQWHGRVIGNHHLGFGPARDVDFFKGANMSFRAAAFDGLRFDERLRGEGAQPHEDLGFSLAVRRRGWRLAYDPAVTVEHYAGRADVRPYSSVAAIRDAAAIRHNAFNMVLALWPSLSPARRLVFAVWSVLVGTGTEPGLVQAVRYTPRLRVAAWRRFWLTQRGKVAAYGVLLRAPKAASRATRSASTLSPAD